MREIYKKYNVIDNKNDKRQELIKEGNILYFRQLEKRLELRIKLQLSLVLVANINDVSRFHKHCFFSNSVSNLLRSASFQVNYSILPSFNAVLSLHSFAGLFFQAANKLDQSKPRFMP